MTQIPISENSHLSMVFFERILDLLSSEVAPEFIDRYTSLKQQREQFLQDHWTAGPDDSAVIYREVDFEYLIASLRKQQTSNGALPRIQQQIAEICLQFGELQKGYDLLFHLHSTVPETNKTRRGNLCLLLGRVEAHRNQWAAAQRWFEESLQHFSQAEDTAGVISAHLDLGTLSAQLWDIAQARTHFSQAQDLLGDQQDGVLGLKLQNNLAIMEGMIGEAAQAADRFATLLTHPHAEAPDYRIHLLINQGIAIKETGDTDKALELLTQAVEEAIALPATRLIGLGSLALSEIMLKQHKFDTGQEHLVRAFKIFSRLHDRSSLADSYRVFGILHRETGYLDLAAAKFDISVAMNTESGDLLTLSETYYEYSLLAKRQKDAAKQREYLEKSLEYAEQMAAAPRIRKLREELDQLL